MRDSEWRVGPAKVSLWTTHHPSYMAVRACSVAVEFFFFLINVKSGPTPQVQTCLWEQQLPSVCWTCCFCPWPQGGNSPLLTFTQQMWLTCPGVALCLLGQCISVKQIHYFSKTKTKILCIYVCASKWSCIVNRDDCRGPWSVGGEHWVTSFKVIQVSIIFCNKEVGLPLSVLP